MTWYYVDRLIMTPGPTDIPLRIRLAMIREVVNPDLDPSFMELYNEVVGKLGKLLNGSGYDIQVLLGEAMLGLEASIANLIKPGDKVLVVANGVFGEGFKDLVRMYGGEPIVWESDWRRAVDPNKFERILERNRDVKAVTIVHCDTPSAILNPVEELAKIADGHGVISIVDSVSAIGGVPIDLQRSKIDILIGGSQKVLNLPSGLTILAISGKAWEAIEKRDYQGFYLNLRLWRDMLQEGVFPYTHNDMLIRGLNESLDMIYEEGPENVYRRHRECRDYSWKMLQKLGLEPYPTNIESSSPTVTAIKLPKDIDEEKLRNTIWKKYGIMIAGSWGKLKGKIIRIGHMGTQADKNKLHTTYTALQKTLKQPKLL